MSASSSLIAFSLLVMGLTSITDGAPNPFKRICYLNLDHEPFLTVEMVHQALKYFDPTLCSHINVMPIAMNGSGDVMANEQNDITKYQLIQDLKMRNPNLKILMTIIADNGIWGNVTLEKGLMQHFAEQSVQFMDQHHFDGLDIDWEFPGWSSGQFDEKGQFTELIQLLRNVYQENYLLTIAVAADYTIIDLAYDIKSISPLVDHVNLMSYDLFDWKNQYPFTGHNAPLYSCSDLPYFKFLNTQYAANYWVQNGCPKEKLMIGIPTYSHSFELVSTSLSYPGAPASGPGPEYSFSQVCVMLQNGGTRFVDTDAMVPYMVIDKSWVSYEDDLSIYLKGAFIKQNGFGGAMVYNINNDDIDGSCTRPEGTRYLLLRTLNQTLTWA